MSDSQHENIDLDALAWTYSQLTGELQRDGKHVAAGYSGAGEGKNNPALDHISSVGPIPRGNRTIAGPPFDTRDRGPCVLRLHPDQETETHGRTGFLMHGDSKTHPGTASHGCIVLPRSIREQVWESGDRELEVVPQIAPAPHSKL